jgi:hypothetical protein
MRPYACCVLSKRGLLFSGVLSVVLLFAVPAAGAGEPGPEAVVVDANGDVVAVAEKRSDAAEVYERAVLTTPTERLKLEYVYRSHGTVPNPPSDPIFSNQWSFAKVGVPTAWAYADGSGVVVAVLDSGINFSPFDGFCTTVVSPYDAIARVEGLADLNRTSEFGHGTHVAGTIAQCTNNGIGVAGIAPGATLMPVRVLSDDGAGLGSDLARGIDWAVSHGADIINLSLGADCNTTWPACSDSTVDGAIARANSAGVLLVASSGNSALPYVSYPSAHPDVVAVGATNQSDVVWYEGAGEGSNQGTSLHMVAPGITILQETTSFGVYDYYYGIGTSMAAPHVSAAAALVLSVDPSLTADEVVSILTNTAIDLGSPGFDTATGWGRIAVDAAVAAVLAQNPSEDPCKSGPCDTITRVDAGGVWGIWERLYQTAAVSTYYYGNPGDFPFMGDWDGNGEATPGLYRQSDGFVYVRHTNTQGNANLEFFFGNPGDVPIVGDFDGDGRDSVSIWRPSQARVFIINELGEDGKGLGEAEFDFYFGNPGDTPFIGDFNGDGIDTIGLYRESTGFVYLTNTLATGNADLAFFYGNPGDQILAGDWDGDGDDTVGVYRPSSGKAFLNLENSNGAADWEAFVGHYPWVITAGRG